MTLDKQLFIQNHKCPEELLHKNFEYPAFYFEYLYFDYLEGEESLSNSTLSFFNNKEISRFYKLINKGFWLKKSRLIPFGSDDDDLFCFHALDSSRIFYVDLSTSNYDGFEFSHNSFIDFVNDMRIENGLKPWSPQSMESS